MIRKISACLFIVITICSCVSTRHIETYDSENLELKFVLYSDENTLNGKLICKNISGKEIKIPDFFLSFSADEIRKHKFRSNWLEIIREDGNKVSYIGNYCDPDFLLLDIEGSDKDYRVMKKSSEFVIDIKDIYYNYDFIPGEKVTIRYNGPLGISNTIECVIANDFLDFLEYQD